MKMEIKWVRFLKVLEMLNERPNNDVVYHDQLFDDVVWAKLFWLLKGKVWKEEEIKTETKITREEKCVQLLRYF